MATEPEPIPPAEPAPSPPAADPPAATDLPSDGDKALGPGGERALAAERDLRREAEKNARAAQRELDKLRTGQMSDQEKAVAAAREEGKLEATRAGAERLAAARIEAALTGVVPDPTAIVEDLALSRYITDDGEVDAAAVTRLRDKYTALGASRAPSVPGVPAGARDAHTPTQLSRSDVQQLYSEGRTDEITKARAEGRLAQLLNNGG